MTVSQTRSPGSPTRWNRSPYPTLTCAKQKLGVVLVGAFVLMVRSPRQGGRKNTLFVGIVAGQPSNLESLSPTMGQLFRLERINREIRPQQ